MVKCAIITVRLIISDWPLHEHQQSGIGPVWAKTKPAFPPTPTLSQFLIAVLLNHVTIAVNGK